MEGGKWSDGDGGLEDHAAVEGTLNRGMIMPLALEPVALEPVSSR